jgi:hypothetical protein
MSKGGLQYFDFYKIEMKHLFARVELLKIHETICDSVHVRRMLTETSCDFITQIWCDGENEDSKKDVDYRKYVLKYLRGSINPQSPLYLDVLVNPIHHVPHGGMPRDGQALSLSTVPDAASLAAAEAASAAAAAAIAAEKARADAEDQARFDARVQESVQRHMMAQQAEMARQHQLWVQNQQQMHRAYAAQCMQPVMFNPHADSNGGGAAASVQSQGAAGVLTKPQGGGWSSWDQSSTPSKY